MNQVVSATIRKQLVKDLKKYENSLKEVKSQKVVDFELYKGIKERIEFLKSRLDFKN
jgi:DNA-binding sugar fermentation-stimulating protein